MDKTESTVRNILTAVEAPLYDISVLSDPGMLPSLDGIPAAAVLDRLSLLKYRNVRGSHTRRLVGRVTDIAQPTRMGLASRRYHADIKHSWGYPRGTQSKPNRDDWGVS
jgi:hypothetical protein